MAMLRITHDLGIVRKMADRVYVMSQGRGGRGGRDGRCVRAAAARLHPPPPLGRAQGQAARRQRRIAPIVLETDDLKVWFPIKRGLLRRTVDHIKAVDGVTLRLRAGETLGVVGESGRARPRSAWLCCA